MFDRIDIFLGRIIFGYGLLHEILPCPMAAKKKSTLLQGHHSSLPLFERLITLACASSEGKFVRFSHVK